jgi:hypothetical protein
MCGSKSPSDVLYGQPGLHVVVLGDIQIVIEVNKLIIPYLPIDYKCGYDKKQADQGSTMCSQKSLLMGILVGHG